MTETKIISHDNNFNLIRLLAALQVAVVHSMNTFGYTFPGADVIKIVPGVPTFFFISGFLIYQSFERVRHKGLASFFKNRVLRIYPALIVCVLLSFLAVYLTGYFDRHPVPAAKLLAWLAAQCSIFQFYNPGFLREFGAGVVNGALWTISVELQFYLLVPVLYYLITRQRGWAIALAVASLAVNLFVRFYLDWQQLGMKLLYVSFAPWLYMFMFGSFLASQPRIRERLTSVNVIALLVVYVLTMLFVGEYSLNAENGINPLSFLVLGVLLLKFAQARTFLPRRLTGFIRKEDFSYGLYLYHMPTINLLLVLGLFPDLVNIFVALIVSMIAAVTSWYVIERPALRLKR